MSFKIVGPICTHSGIIHGEFVIPHSGVWLLYGENGIGKSTVVQFIKLNENLRNQFTISFLDQFPLTSLNEMTVKSLIENLQMDFSNFNIEDELKNLFEKFFESSLLQKSINQLSGGENQLLKLIICLGFDADLYVLDEPTTFLDVEKNNHFLKMINSFKKKQKSFLIVEHRKEQLREILDGEVKIIRDEKGELMFYGQ